MKEYPECLQPLFVDEGTVLRAGEWERTYNDQNNAVTKSHKVWNFYALRDTEDIANNTILWPWQ